MQLGLYTFAELGPATSGAQRMRELVEEIVLADEVGLDVFGVGEHHRPDFVVSSVAGALAIVAALLVPKTGSARAAARQPTHAPEAT